MKAKRIEFTKADDGTFISRTSHEQPEHGPFIEAATATHPTLDDAKAHMEQAFGGKGLKARAIRMANASRPQHG